MANDLQRWVCVCKCGKSYVTESVNAYRTFDTVILTPGPKGEMGETDPVKQQFPRIHMSPAKTQCDDCASGKKKKKQMDI